MDISQTQLIDVNDLCIGHYVFLDLGWMQHPFPLNHFKIQSQAQIDTICELGLTEVRYVPMQSDSQNNNTALSVTEYSDTRLTELWRPLYCDEIQGYLYAPALPTTEFEQLLQQQMPNPVP